MIVQNKKKSEPNERSGFFVDGHKYFIESQ